MTKRKNIDPKELLDLNALLSDRVRLIIMCTLSAAEEPINFTSLLRTLELTKGNLSTHMRKLEMAGLVEVNKDFVERKPRTTYACTPKGKKEIARYLEKVEQMLQMAKHK